MTAKPYPTDLTDAEWDCIKDVIPPPKPGGRRRALDMRAVVNAIFYVVDGGIKWRMLPHDYPNHNSVYWYFSQWRDSGDWHRIHDTLRAQVRQQAGRHKHPDLPTGALDFSFLIRYIRHAQLNRYTRSERQWPPRCFNGSHFSYAFSAST
jgi:transposase